MNATLVGRTVLVTGAGRGLGNAIAAKLAAEGAAVAVHYRESPEGAYQLVEEILASEGRAIAVAGDLRDINVCRKILASRCNT